MSFPINKYKFYSDGKGKIIAVSSYAGKTVKGTAKCDPRDTFDEDYGKECAAARCSAKIAEKRLKRAKLEQKKAVLAVDAAMRRIQKMNEYVADSERELKTAREKLEKFN